jgi:trehalose 6-phosphate phosphatase
MQFRTEQARERYDGLVRVASRVVVGLDFDGTLSPIVPDPAQARIHPDGPRVLATL